jgi:serine/threonine protein kinase
LKFLTDTVSKDSLQRRSPGRSALNHPNICTLHDIGEETGTAFIAMEYLDGVALDFGWQKWPIPPKS